MSKRRGRPPGNRANAGASDNVVTNDGDNAGDNGNADVGASEAVAATVDPGEFVGDEQSAGTTDAPSGRRRGRPPGSGGKGKAKPIPLNVTGLEKLLVGIHGGLAILSGRIEWMLDTDAKIFDGKTEAEFLAGSIKDVADHYGHGLLDQKTLDWMNLIQCLALVYGGRIFAIRSAPKIKASAPKPVSPHFTPSQPAQHHRTAPPVNEFSPNEPANSATIAGIGEIDLPDDHPLSPNFKPRMN